MCFFSPPCWHVPYTMKLTGWNTLLLWWNHVKEWVCLSVIIIIIIFFTLRSPCDYDTWMSLLYLLMAGSRLCFVFLRQFFSPVKWHHQVETLRRCQHLPLNLQHFLLSSNFYTVQQYFLFITNWPDVMTHIKSKHTLFDQWPGFIGLFSYSAFKPLSWVVIPSHRAQDAEGSEEKKKKKKKFWTGLSWNAFAAGGHSQSSSQLVSH